MSTRRGVLLGLLAAGMAPAVSWADVGAPAFLTAGQAEDGRNFAYGLSKAGRPLFRVPLSDRGHAAAAHPDRPELVAFARRPGRFAVVIDCLTGRVRAHLGAPTGRHFYGHGVFSADGSVLFTTENDYEAGTGGVGLWDVRAGYRRIGEFSSGGIGPHDIRLMPDGETLVVANGGIETHPDTGRAKLNLADMQSNLTYLSTDGALIEQVGLPPEHRLNSIRHLDARRDGRVAFVMQWQGDKTQFRPVLGFHRQGDPPEIADASDAQIREMAGYGGSVAFFDQGRRVAVTSPRGNTVQLFDTGNLRIVASHRSEDVCGLGATDSGLYATTGNGAYLQLRTGKVSEVSRSPVRWDNHMVPVNLS